MAERILTRRERFAARVCTGPLAHFVAGFTDWTVAVTAHLRSRRSRRR